MKYSKICITCNKEYEVEVNPQTEKEWKDVQNQVNKKNGLCANCMNINDDSCMDLNSQWQFTSSDFQYISQTEKVALYDKAMALDLKAITEKYNVLITTVGGGQESIEILCEPKDVENIKQDILSYKRIQQTKKVDLFKFKGTLAFYKSLYGGSK